MARPCNAASRARGSGARSIVMRKSRDPWVVILVSFVLGFGVGYMMYDPIEPWPTIVTE